MNHIEQSDLIKNNIYLIYYNGNHVIKSGSSEVIFCRYIGYNNLELLAGIYSNADCSIGNIMDNYAHNCNVFGISSHDIVFGLTDDEIMDHVVMETI